MSHRRCVVNGCENDSYCRGVCIYHYRRLPDRKRSNLASTRKWRKNNPEIYKKHCTKKYGDRIFIDRKRHFGSDWKKVFERDGYKCTECGMSNEEHIKKFKRTITIHHIDGKGRYSKKMNNSINNLITLCLSCHGRIDRTGCFKRRVNH